MRIIKDSDFLISAWRRSSWFIENLTLKKLVNLCAAGSEFALKRERMIAWPLVLKIDLSPLCNLQCTVCVHAKPNGEEYLKNQYFHKSHKMPVKSYRRIIDEIKGRSTAVSLYYMGEPLLHPDLDEMCHIAHKAGLNVHISTNFSFRLRDKRIRSLVESGVTHITVAIDGLSQETYGLTRINGNIEWVLSNLKRLCQFKQERGQLYPKIEVQYLNFKHNLNELEPALRLFKELKVDQVTIKSGEMENWASLGLRKEKVVCGETNNLFPKCIWPYFFMLVKYNGDVIPCCTYRESEQYSVNDDSRSVGNVFQTSVREIWNSPNYSLMRRLLSNPATGSLEAESEKSFCYGCRKVYKLNERNQINGVQNQWEINEI